MILVAIFSKYNAMFDRVGEGMRITPHHNIIHYDNTANGRTREYINIIAITYRYTTYVNIHRL